MSPAKKYIVSCLLGLLLSGCDNTHKVYLPPTLKGTGTMYVFEGYDGYEDNFLVALNQWLSKNEVRLISIEAINRDENSHPQQYIVVVQYPPDRIPANPAPPDPNANNVER